MMKTTRKTPNSPQSAPQRALAGLLHTHPHETQWKRSTGRFFFAAGIKSVLTYHARGVITGDSQMKGAVMFGKTAMLCLALNAYFEARGEGVEGIHAVTHVVINRIDSPRWPDEACEVVFQPWQFTWTMEETYEVKEDVLAEVYEHVVDAVQLPDSTRGATHYHATYVSPKWAGIYPRTAFVGDHIFYKALPGM